MIGFHARLGGSPRNPTNGAAHASAEEDFVITATTHNYRAIVTLDEVGVVVSELGVMNSRAFHDRYARNAWGLAALEVLTGRVQMRWPDPRRGVSITVRVPLRAVEAGIERMLKRMVGGQQRRGNGG